MCNSKKNGMVCPYCSDAVVRGKCVGCRCMPPDYSSFEFVMTPPEVTKTLLEKEDFSGVTWEPCCGNGAIAELLPGKVIASDLADYKFGESGVDFLKTERKVDNIVTNPPFGQKVSFKRHALKCARRKVALLLPVRNLGIEIEAKSPLKAVYVFRRRIDFDNAELGWRMAWYVLEHAYHGHVHVEWVTPTHFMYRRRRQ